MAARLSTTQAAAYRIGPTANPAAIQSPLSAVYDHQGDDAGSAYRRLPHGHGVIPDQPHSAAVLLDLTSQVCGGKLRAVAHVADARSFIRRSRQAPALLSIHAPGSRPVMAQSVRDQLPQQFAIAEFNHLPSALSSVARLVGIHPNENGLTHETIPLSPRGKTYD